MDLEARRKLGGLIDKATSTGLLSLEPQPLRQIKAVARKSDENVKSAFHFLSQKLKADSSEVRYLALLLVNEFFTRSACFRTLLIDEFQNFLELVVGTKVYKPLPPPSERAVQLRQKGLEFIENWHEQYGHANKQLRVGHHYLKHSLRMRFPEVRLQSEIAERERKQREEQTQKILRVKFERVRRELDDYVGELRPLLREMEGCFDILMPRLPFDPPAPSAEGSDQDLRSREEGKGKEKEGLEEKEAEGAERDDEGEPDWDSVDTGGGDEGKEDEEEEDEEEVDDVLRRHGIGNASYELDISFDKSFASVMEDEEDENENEDEDEEWSLAMSMDVSTESAKKGGGRGREGEGSQPVVECLRNDLRAMKRRYVPLVDEWYDVLLKVEFPLHGSNTDEMLDTDDSSSTASSVEGEEDGRNAEKRRERDRLLRQVIDLRSAIAAAVRKCGDLGIEVDETKRAKVDDNHNNKGHEDEDEREKGTMTDERREGEVGEEESREAREVSESSSSSSSSRSHHDRHDQLQHQQRHKRTFAELFGESEDEDEDEDDNEEGGREEKRAKTGGYVDDGGEDERQEEKGKGEEEEDEDEDEEEDEEDDLEFEEVSMIEEEGEDESKAGDESYVTDSPMPTTRFMTSSSSSSPTSSSLSVPPSPYSSSSSPATKKKSSKKEDVKVRERLRKKLGISAKRRPPVVRPAKKLSTHRPLML